MLFPTFYGEGLPNYILEGMLYGMPIVSRVNGAIPEVVKHDINGYLTDSMDSATFADYIRQIVLDVERYRQMALTNHRVAQGRFTTERVKERFLAVYEGMGSQLGLSGT
jgi:glycosyltransferase involved in cell wall biosynthesis